MKFLIALLVISISLPAFSDRAPSYEPEESYDEPVYPNDVPEVTDENPENVPYEYDNQTDGSAPEIPSDNPEEPLPDESGPDESYDQEYSLIKDHKNAV